MNLEFPATGRSKTMKLTALVVVVVLIIFYGLIPHLKAFGLSGIKHLPTHVGYYVLAAVIFTFVFACSSLNYKQLAFSKLKFLRTLIIQFASVPLNILLPAGIGNISANYLYLRKNNHSPTQAGLVVGLNNTIGVVANLSVIIFLLLTFGFSGSLISTYTRHGKYLLYALGAFLLVAAITLWLFKSNIKKISLIKTHLIVAIDSYRLRPLAPLRAYFFSLLQCSITGLVFWLTLKSFGLSAPYAVTFLIYALSVGVGALLPTPGGLGGVEASMTAGMVGAHIGSTSQSLIVVLGYRAVTFWLPMIIGVFALGAVEKMKLIRWRS